MHGFRAAPCLIVQPCSVHGFGVEPYLSAAADSVAPDGAALLGLGYGSDADSQDSGASGRVQKPRAGKSQAELSSQENRASPRAESQEVKDTAGDSGAAGQQGEEQEEERKDPQDLLPFVKGQRCNHDMLLTPNKVSECIFPSGLNCNVLLASVMHVCT